MRTIGIVLVVLGIIALVYGGISYNRHRTVLDMGSMSITATEHNDIPFSPIAGALALIGGSALLMVNRRRA